MTTINNMEDLIRLLDENPQWVEALRARLLTRDLLELPEKFATFAEETNRRFERQEQQFATFAEETNQQFAQIARRFERQEQQFRQMDKRLDVLENGMAKIQVDMGYLRGAHARNAAIEDAGIIAEYMGLHRVRNLSREDLWEMTKASDVTRLTPGELRSFRHADLVMETTDSEGQPRYVAAEISFTVNGRDTSRAIRNARLLTDFTGIAADPAVIGVYRDHGVQYAMDSGELYWYPLSDDDLEVD